MGQRRSSLSIMQREIDSAAALSKIDWVTIGNSVYSWTFEELSHYSHCEVSPYVVAVACALCSQFNITTSAREELEDLRQKLDTLEYDSSNHMLRVLMASDEGLIVVGVCGILNEYFEWMALAEFFETLTAMSGMPEEMRPTRVRWLELARIGGKIPPLRSFHTLVRRFSQLAAEGAYADGLKECAGPIGVVGCMQTMSSISSGEEDGRIIMFCGRSAGWHAAMAEWMFGLRIKLTTRDSTAPEGKAVYSNGQDDQVQLTVTLNNPGIPSDGEVFDDPPMPIKDQGDN